MKNRKFILALIFVGVALFVGLLYLVMFVIPEEEKKPQEIVKTEVEREGVSKSTSENKELPEKVVNVENTLPGARGDYIINVKLDENKKFHISAEIEVTNESDESWEDIGFDFTPKGQFPPYSGQVTIISTTKKGEKVDYDLTNNKLFIKLDDNLEPGKSTQVKIEYTLELPENGFRLSRIDDNYFLAHWYPMLGRYQSGWEIRDYFMGGETYDTNYGDYVVNFELPKEYLVASSGNEGEIKSTSVGKIEGDNIKDFYIALLDPNGWVSKTAVVNDTTLRLFFPVDVPDISEDVLEDAVTAFSYFEEKIGDNPVEELDIIANNGRMEYPNIIEVPNDSIDFENTLVHEIAHQWFYYMVSNDPYTDAWLDESITVFLTSMHLTSKRKLEAIGFEQANYFASLPTTIKYSNTPLNDFGEDYASVIYGKTPVLLRDFFKEHGGQEEALKFLSAYYNEYQYKYVDSDTFAAFFNNYFEEDYSEFFDEWLELK